MPVRGIIKPVVEGIEVHCGENACWEDTRQAFFVWLF